MKITLCGSARFEPYFHLWNEILSLAGHTVYTLSVFPSLKNGNKNWYSNGEKTILDNIHLDKIKNSDAIVVLNVNAYIGESTLKEIEFAKNNKKELYCLESWGKGNGICTGTNTYFSWAIEHAKKYDCLGKGSPIDTMHPYFNYAYDLLGPGGPFRSNLVEKINEFKKNDGRKID